MSDQHPTALGVHNVTLDFSAGLVLLLPISARPEPSFCTHGQVQCQFCETWCYLGHDTLKEVQKGVIPVCVPCVRKIPFGHGIRVTQVKDPAGGHDD